jgi:hypothetical protein
MKFFKYALIALFSVTLISCSSSSSDGDSEKPTVSISSPTGKIVSGSMVTVSFTTTDNEELKAYTVSITKSTKTVDGTFPKGGSNVTEDKDGKALESIEGLKTKNVSFQLSTETGNNQVAAPGTYNVVITVTDKAGNSNSASGSFELTDPNKK